MNSEGSIVSADLLESLTPIANGYRVKVVDGFAIEVWKMLFNWRLVVFEADQSLIVEHGYCYFGTGPDALIRAAAAGLAWEDPLNTDPIGFDKKAF